MIQMGSCLPLFLFLSSLPAISSLEILCSVEVDGETAVSQTDDHFICATIDWWPQDKCNYNQCPWENTSAINLNLSHPLLAKTIQAFESLRIRIGGSLQDQVLYDVGNLKSSCHPFRKMDNGLFGFSKGCFQMSRWDELNKFFNNTGVLLAFGLNALHGRHQVKKTEWIGDWNSSNALDLMNYTISKGYRIDSWEFGNELSGEGIGASVGAEQYGKDLINLKNNMSILYVNSKWKPQLIAPGGFFQQQWFAKMLEVSGPNVVEAVSHHIYNLGPGNDPTLASKILNPDRLSDISSTFANLRDTILKNGPWSSAWVGEAGGAYNSGGRSVSNTFVNSFWYLDQLGMAAIYSTKVYCRQTLIGGNYGLLNTTTFAPNPDYSSALLWDRLMGKGVLKVQRDASPHLRAYAHCTKGREGVTLLLINLSNETRFVVDVKGRANNAEIKSFTAEANSIQSLKKSVTWVGTKASDVTLFREEYHLTPKDGDLQSQTMVLNGIPLELTKEGEFPNLEPLKNEISTQLSIAPFSIAFVVIPNFNAPACS